jgi:hypothetical protein
MTLHPIPSEFPYIRGKFCYIFYHCAGVGGKGGGELILKTAKSGVFFYLYIY